MKKWLTGILAMLAALTGCQRSEPQGTKALEMGQAVYYWRTELRLDSVERAFLRTHDIKKVYCRYFDVVMRDGEPMPNATLRFNDTLPKGIEMVPTIYITEDCMHARHEWLAKKLVERIRQMNETNDISGVKEIQIDCDYTARSRKTYYEFLKEIQYQLSARPKVACYRRDARIINCRLSTTIRLHQLSMPAPPVDYGVLMIYNTGDPQKFMERNPILDMRDVAPYLNRLKGYALPLAAAYPVYSWQRQIHGVHIEHKVEADEILRVKTAVESKRPELRRAIMTYCLDKENINRYKTETYEAIYHH
jgi:hypothetical protein